jgi:hypothetical protein
MNKVGALLVVVVGGCAIMCNGSLLDACVPGASIVCVGVGGCSGGQTCQSNGTYGVCACFSSDGGVDAAVPEDASVDVSPNDVGIDVAMDVSTDAPMIPCATSNFGMGGIDIPAGTIATATASATGSPPSLAVDGDITTAWTAPSMSGAITLTFPSPVTFDGIRFAASAGPPDDVTYSITGVVSGFSSQIGMATIYVPQPEIATILQPISVTPGTYSAVTIAGTASSTWISINEIALITASCPADAD